MPLKRIVFVLSIYVCLLVNLNLLNCKRYRLHIMCDYSAYNARSNDTKVINLVTVCDLYVKIRIIELCCSVSWTLILFYQESKTCFRNVCQWKKKLSTCMCVYWPGLLNHSTQQHISLPYGITESNIVWNYSGYQVNFSQISSILPNMNIFSIYLPGIHCTCMFIVHGIFNELLILIFTLIFCYHRDW